LTLRVIRAEFHRPAFRHGVDRADIEWALDHVVVVDEVGDDDSPRRWLVLGVDGGARMLELIVLVFDDGREMVIHAMTMQAKYETLLPRSTS
jgi:uncharacterized DUF497 family protein